MNWKKNTIFFLSIAICCIPLFLTFNRGINYFDEGYIVEGAREMLIGKLPYRDFHFVYTPGVIYYLAVFLRIFGQYIIVERIAAMILSIVGIIFLGLLVQKYAKNFLLVFLSMFVYVLWGPAQINFLWPVMCVLPLMFIYLFLFFKSHFFLAGIILGSVLLYKQNFGVALIIALFVYILVVRHSRRQLLPIFIGFICVMGMFILRLLSTGSLTSFIIDMNTYTIQEILLRKSFSVPFPTQSMGKFLLYSFPGIVSSILIIRLVRGGKKNRFLLLIPLSLFLMYLFGIFPTPDWTHLMPLISMTGILIALIPLCFGDIYKRFTYLLLTIMICAGVYSITMRNYYRWEAPFIKQNHCSSTGVMKYICIDEKNYAVITQSVALIEKEADKDIYIFAFYNNPIYYFLTQKNNPTSFIDFNVKIGKKEELRVINELGHKKVRVIITRFPPQNNQSKIISEYIEKNYRQTYSVYEFTVWKRK